MNQRRFAAPSKAARPVLAAAFVLATSFCALPALANAAAAAPAAPAEAAPEPPPAPTAEPATKPDRLGAYFELDVGVLIALRQSAAFAGGAVYGPFLLGLSYATFLSNPSLGGVPDGFTLRANDIGGLNAGYVIA